MDFEPEYRWPNVSYKAIRVLEEVPESYPFRSRIFRSSFDVSGFPFCKRIELYCIAEPGNRALVFDTGHPDLCGTAALDGIEQTLHIPWSQTEVFLSHFHDDHDGNLLYCVQKGARKLYSGPTQSDSEALLDKFLVESASLDLKGESAASFIRLVASGNKAQTQTKGLRCELHGGEVLSIAGYHLEALLTPGHTSNHLCLIDRNKKILFAGDHICYAPPGCMQFAIDEHLVSRYVESLAQLKELNLQTVYMCHHNPLLGSLEINCFITMLEDRYETLVIRARKLFADVDTLTVRQAAIRAAAHYPNGLEGFPVSTQINRIATIFGTLEYLYDLGMLSRTHNDEGALEYHRLW